MKTIIARAVCCFAFIIGINFFAFAQPEENGGDPPPSDVPIDGGTSILIATGVAYGLKKIKREKRK